MYLDPTHFLAIVNRNNFLKHHIVSPGIDPGYSWLPPVKKKLWIVNWRIASVWNYWKIFISAPGRHVMTLCECHVDHPFPYQVIRCWVSTSPPPCSMGLGHLFKPTFWGLTLRHRNAVTWTCDQHAWFSFIYIAIVITPPFCNNTGSLEYAFFLFYLFCFFSGGLPFFLFQSSKELLFSSPFFE